MADNPPRRRNGNKKPRKQIIHTTIAATEPPKEPKAFVDHVLKLTNHRAEVRALTDANLARLQPTEPPETNGNSRVIPTELKREANLSALKTWQELASARLADLRAGRTGSGPEAQPIPTSQPETAKLMRRLVIGLSKNAARISTLEGAQRRWHTAAKAAREGIALRRDTAREVAGESLRPDAHLDLKLAHATFMLEGNSPKLRNELKQAAELSPKSKGLPYWLARYEIMAGNYTAAQAAATAAPDYAPMRQIITPMLDPESTQAPWLTWPCNFYAYRYTLADSTQLRHMQEVLAALHNDPSLAETWNETFHVPLSVINDLKSRAIHGSKAISSLLLWNQANLDMQRSKYASAARNYTDCQRSIVNYFAGRYPQFKLPELSPPDESGSDIAPEQQVEDALNVLAGKLINFNFSPTHLIWTYFRERYATLTLDELHQHDWQRPNVVPLAFEFQEPIPDFDDFNNIGAGFVLLAARFAILKAMQFSGEKMEEKIDAPLLAIALVFCPMAIAEANRLRRHFDKALHQCNMLLTRHSQFQILSQVIEKPFVQILRAQVLLDKADAQFKARTMARPPRTEYQGLEAATTYQGVLVNFQDQGQYVNLVKAGVESMNSQLEGLLERTFNPVAASELAGSGTQPPITPDERQALAQLGKKITIQTITPRQGDFPEPDRRISPHESLVQIEAPNANGTPAALLETNPLIYSLIIQANARLLQMESGLNYLGYSDEYTPPWRFQFLLDRARYFAEHAKNAQREYLNFLSNAEREEFQELTGAQNVEMEKSNIRVETARVDQVKLELESAKASEELAQLTAQNAEQRLTNFEDFDERADELADQALGGAIASGIGAVFSGAAQGAIAGAAAGGIGALAGGIIGGIGGLLGGGGQVASQRAQLETADEQREFEKKNLGLAVSEANQAAIVALRQRGVTQAGLMVAGMQRAAAVLRHEFALQNLAFLRNRTLNAEMWYRLSAAIRSVADTYLRYGIEMAFLTEQAYEFEADKRINVIRFDYDVSDLGDSLAGDFLLRDLDTLEQDLIVGQKIRQQQVRYVLSLAREFPTALQELRDNSAMTFSMRLEQLERRFPGLFNLRISSVDVLPVALMEATRFSLELTHLGSGQVRLHANSTGSGELLGADWLSGVETDWSIRLRTTPPETAVFSGLTRQDLAGLPSLFTANQRGAFEGVAGASAWRVDLSMKENRIVPDSLADILITFTLSGYYDPLLSEAVNHAPRTASATTTWFAAHLQFPDAFYQFNQSGRMDWHVNQDFLALRGSVGALRNVAVLGVASQKRLELGRLMCAYPVEFEVDATGGITLLRALPQFSLSTNGLILNATLNTPPGSVVTFDFGDGTGLSDSASLLHTYARPGRYDVLVRIATNGRLTEYRAAVIVSRQHTVQPPCIGIPSIQTTVVGNEIKLEPSLLVPSGEVLSVVWRIDGKQADAGSDPVTFTVAPGRYVLRFSAIRPLSARFYSQQRFDPAAELEMKGLRLASNRNFDLETGAETTTSPNAFAQHVFRSDVLAPTDRWTLELPLDDNPSLLSVSSTDVKQVDLSDLSDIVLALEYEVRDV
jgi:hypothetical protein